jgi:eukaryotic-like serine/threonine-protein kinase
MSNPQTSIQNDRVTSRIRAVVNQYLQRRAAGESLPDNDLIALHPELMPRLAEELRKAALRSVPRDVAAQNIDSDTRAYQQLGTYSGHLQVRCPDCHAPMEVAMDTHLTDLSCGACGIHFSLLGQNQSTRTAPTLSKLGRFELIARLGVGGFGSVWKARDKELDRTVAIKIPRARGMTVDEQERFFREARCSRSIASSEYHERPRGGARRGTRFISSAILSMV